MKSTTFLYLSIVGAFAIIVFSSCATTGRNGFSEYNFSTKNTLSIFLLNNERGPFFCIPIQYDGEYKISNFVFTNGEIQIGDYNISLQKDDARVFIYLNETEDQYDIFIERYLSDDEMKNIIGEYNKGNVHSKYAVWYDMVIDGTAQNGSGVLDNFELYSGPDNDYEYLSLFPNLEYFRSVYLTNGH